MAIIDPEGLFSGERLAACSDLAQLYWPRFFLAANGRGRLELTYKSLISRVFGNFQKVPESSEIWKVFREYETNFLAVIYEAANGGWWCQFTTSEKYLPKFKTRRDEMSPAPPLDLVENARKGYLQWKKAKSIKNQSFQKSSENFSRRGVGEGVGEEKGKTSTAEVPPPPSPPVNGRKKKTPLPILVLPDWLPVESWEAWVEMRKETKKPLTDHAKQLAIEKLEKFHRDGYEVKAIVDAAVLRNWQGFFIPKDEGGNLLQPKPPQYVECSPEEWWRDKNAAG